MDSEDLFEKEYLTSEIDFLQSIQSKTDTKSHRVSDVLFSTALKKCGAVLLKKGQTPTIKKNKKENVKEIIDFIRLEKGITINEHQIRKKLNNMKSRVKTKIDNNKTGNRKAALNMGEKMLLEMLIAEDNLSAHNAKSNIDDDNFSVEDLSSHSIVSGSSDLNNVHKVRNEYKDLSLQSSHSGSQGVNNVDIVNDDSEETSNLTTTELERLVLVKQMEVFEVQKNTYKRFNKILFKAENLIDLQTKYYSKRTEDEN